MKILKKGLKQNRIKNIFLNFFGLFYIIISFMAFYNSIEKFGLESILWFSYFAFLLIGIGILFRNSYLIGSQLNIIFIPYLVWTIDFFYSLLASKSLWGITDYVFLAGPPVSKIVTIQHVFIIPIALISLYFIRLKRKDFWKFSLIHVVVIFFLTRIFSEPIKNINCAFKNCLPFGIGGFYYPAVWFIAYILMVSIINFSLIKIKIFNIKNKK